MNTILSRRNIAPSDWLHCPLENLLPPWHFNQSHDPENVFLELLKINSKYMSPSILSPLALLISAKMQAPGDVVSTTFSHSASSKLRRARQTAACSIFASTCYQWFAIAPCCTPMNR